MEKLVKVKGSIIDFFNGRVEMLLNINTTFSVVRLFLKPPTIYV